MRLGIVLLLIISLTYNCQEKSDLEIALGDEYKADVIINDSIPWTYNLASYRYLGGDTIPNLSFSYYGEESKILREAITLWHLPITEDTIKLHTFPIDTSPIDTDKPFARLVKWKADQITGIYTPIDHPDVDNYIKFTKLPQDKNEITGSFELVFKKDKGLVLDTIKLTEGSFKAKYLELDM